MASQELQSVLRFLSQDARVPLATAMSKVKELQKASLMAPETLAKADLTTITSIFDDAKIAKQVQNAAKRVTKKRTTSDAGTVDAPTKRGKKVSMIAGSPLSDTELEESLAFATSDKGPEELAEVELFTNRAPLVLAFCLVLLKHTMPDQPLSSRLSLAQAYVSVSSRSRAVDLGIETGASAQDEGFGSGQPTVKIMGKDLKVMRRSGYDDGTWGKAEEDVSTQGTIGSQTGQSTEKEPALWGLDAEALKASTLANAKVGHKSNAMPIYTPQSARQYLLKAAGTPPDNDNGDHKKKKTAAAAAEEVEANLGMLLKAIDIVYASWAPELGPAGLDRRTWGWYASVRPDIAQGKAGWGGKNVVKLKHVLALRKKD